MDISLGNTNIYYFKEINCKKAVLNYDFSRMVNNLEVISVMVYQYLIIDILGRPLTNKYWLELLWFMMKIIFLQKF